MKSVFSLILATILNTVSGLDAFPSLDFHDISLLQGNWFLVGLVNLKLQHYENQEKANHMGCPSINFELDEIDEEESDTESEMMTISQVYDDLKEYKAVTSTNHVFVDRMNPPNLNNSQESFNWVINHYDSKESIVIVADVKSDTIMILSKFTKINQMQLMNLNQVLASSLIPSVYSTDFQMINNVFCKYQLPADQTFSNIGDIIDSWYLTMHYSQSNAIQAQPEYNGRVSIRRLKEDSPELELEINLQNQNYSSTFIPSMSRPYIWYPTENVDSLIVSLADQHEDLYVLASNTGNDVLVLSGSPAMSEQQETRALTWFANQNIQRENISLVSQSCIY